MFAVEFRAAHAATGFVEIVIVHEIDGTRKLSDWVARW